MRIPTALTQAKIALKKWSDKSLSQSRATARRLATVAEMYEFWTARSWMMPHDVIDQGWWDMERDDVSLPQVFFETNEALINGVAGLKEGRPAEPTWGERIIIDGVLDMLRGTRDFLTALCDGTQFPENTVCMTCGTTAAGDQCPICLGRGNQIANWWDT